MKKIIFVSLVLVSALAQDYVYKQYDIETIRQALQIPESEKQHLGIDNEQPTSTFVEATHQLSDRQIVNTIRSYVASDTWTGKASLEIDKKFLHVIQKQDVHNELRHFLQRIKQQFLQTMYAEIEVIDLSQNESVYQESVYLSAGQNNNIAISTYHSYVCDYDVEVAESSTTADPVIQNFNEGFHLQLIPFRSFDNQSVYLFGGASQVKLNKMDNVSPKEMSEVDLPQSEHSGSYGTFRVPIAKKSLLTYYNVNNKVHAIYVTIHDEKDLSSHVNKDLHLYDGGLLYYLLSTPDYENEDPFSKATHGVVLVNSSKVNGGALFEEQVVTQKDIDHYQKTCQKLLGKHQICGRMIISSSQQNILPKLKKIERDFGSTYNVHLRIYEMPNEKYKEVIEQRNITQKQHKMIREYIVKDMFLSGVQHQKSQSYNYTEYKTLQDYDVEVATNAAIGDPITGMVREGVDVSIQVEKNTEFLCHINLEKYDIAQPIATKNTLHGPIHVPKVSRVFLQQRLRLPSNKERIVKRITRGKSTTLLTLECK
ncbi:hypothetical protein [Candidatus Uabimicrobium amorphum]|uniref:Uncharacterized protein n=1 Tax=Uabimicrobium amorphum TaxID=2596890 RepID=A0A5S9IPC0_UABAM|nr:hypothetical protein [Candidatus Uabimicrobium amorphum]BBM85613.1 hypothetical protein UABAM_03987 [Candidatus Uabimicrobium amorphum]